jgi:hypothetical protein
LRRVLFFQSPSLVGAGIRRLLSDIDGLEVIALDANARTNLGAEIEHVRPDVTILSGVGTASADTGQLTVYFHKCPDMRMLVVSEVDNLIYVYDKQRMVVTKADDLADLIHGP